ncbi:MAG: CARDB domain-containing protein [Solirubrobacteraceae bacterium]
MRHFAATSVGTLALLAAAPPAALAAPSAQARVATCHLDPVQDQRYAVFTGEMASLRRGNRMEMRFELERRAPGEGAFVPVDVPKLGVWNRAKPGRSPYRFNQRVEKLAAPATYRARVTFRWTGPNGAKKVVARRVTPPCKQPDFRGDLRLRAVGAQRVPGTDKADYTVEVRNAGRTVAESATGFDVVLGIDGVALPATTLNGLAPGDRRELTFRGPRCRPSDGSATAVVDPDNRVDEAGEGNNVIGVPCPPGPAGQQ